MKRRLWFGLGTALLAAVALGTQVPRLWSSDQSPTALTPAQERAVSQLKTFSDGFAAVAAAVVPSVVTVTSEKTVQPADNPFSAFGSDPFFRHFFGGQTPSPHPFTQRGLGSGVIVNPDGYILTNNHVVRGADELMVTLNDGRHIKAKVVGTDSRTDLAVLKIDEKGLPAIRFGDSDKVKIGEWVLAVGSPFSENLEATVTAGIVSAKGRSGMRLADYEDFIQTDAAINPGNSGGALVDLDGELIGINSAIASRAGGSNGIGFSIPSNLAMEVMDDLIQHGKVTRGFLGVGIQGLNDDLVAAMNLDSDKGVLVTSLADNSPAGDAGVQQGDVIVAFDGKPVDGTDQLRFAVARKQPGSMADVTVIRDGRRKTFHVKLGEFAEDNGTAGTEKGETGSRQLGMSVNPVTPQLQQQFNLPDATGLVVTAVDAGSPADDAGIQPGDVIHAVNRHQVDSTSAYLKAIDNTPKGKPVLLQVQRQENTFFVAIRPE